LATFTLFIVALRHNSAIDTCQGGTGNGN
jgi:hypothetical protein